MKQYTTPEQTAKLIELGFAEPKGHFCKKWRGETPLQDRFTFDCNYSIGELIEMLQKKVNQIEDSGIPCDLNIHYDGGTWLIVYICERDGRFKTERLELIDALYDMIVTLKGDSII